MLLNALDGVATILLVHKTLLTDNFWGNFSCYDLYQIEDSLLKFKKKCA